MNIYELRGQVDSEIIDFNQLHAMLQDYAHPRGKISQWLKCGDLLRVKKGLYLFGEKVRRQGFSVEVLANLIYGPSAISMEYALSFHGLIPEAVYTVTSITSKRNKYFSTPVGDFSYKYLHPTKFSIGIRLEKLANNAHALMASAEKALCDIVTLTSKDIKFSSQSLLTDYLFDDLRLEEEGILELSMEAVNEIARVYRNKRLTGFTQELNLWIENNG